MGEWGWSGIIARGWSRVLKLESRSKGGSYTAALTPADKASSSPAAIPSLKAKFLSTFTAMPPVVSLRASVSSFHIDDSNDTKFFSVTTPSSLIENRMTVRRRAFIYAHEITRKT